MEMLHGHIAETNHIYQQQASAQVNDANRQQLAYIGYLSNYNPQTGYGTVVNPENCDNDGNAILTGPIPIITSWIGTANGQNPITGNNDEPWGIQIHPFGGAMPQTLRNADGPGGEQVLVIQARPESGYAATGFLLPNNLALPPGGDQIPIIGRQIRPGEMLIVSPAQAVVLLDEEGSIHVYTQQVENAGGNLKAGVAGGIRLQTTAPQTLVDDPDQGDIDIIALQDLTLTSQQGTIDETAQNDINQTATTGQITRQAATGIDDSTTTGNFNLTSTAGNVNITSGLAINNTAGGAIVSQATTNINNNAGAAITNQATGLQLATAGTTFTITGGVSVTINSPIVNIGTPTTYLTLLTVAFLAAFNTHIHDGVTAGAGVSGTPTVPVLPGTPITTEALAAN